MLPEPLDVVGVCSAWLRLAVHLLTRFGSALQSKIAANPLPVDSGARRRQIVAMLSLAGLAVALRVLQLQVVDSARLAARGTRQKSYVEILPAPPGDLLDRDGRVLATSIIARSLYVVPEKIRDSWPCAQRLARALY